MGQRSIPAPFLTKTYELVDDEETEDVVSWGQNGNTFVVWKIAEFARDMLPKYFKHNNFSSFVRQLNTYGFHKIVPDKWEFANDNFKKDQKQLLISIRRRKTLPSAGKPTQVSTSSGDDGGSTSTTSSVEIADLSGENEKLKKVNDMLSSELAQTKKKCEELVGFLTRNLNVGPDQITRILKEETQIGNGELIIESGGALENGVVGDDVDDDDKEEEKDGLKLFGVWLEQGTKRARRCCVDLCGSPHRAKVMKTR